MEDANQNFKSNNYDLETEPLTFDRSTIYVGNIHCSVTDEFFTSIMSENYRKIKKYQLFPPKKDSSTTIGLVTFATQAEAQDAKYWVNGINCTGICMTAEYARRKVREIKNFVNPWWNDACDKAYLIQRKAWNKYNHRPLPENFLEYKKAKTHFRAVRRQCIKYMMPKQRPKVEEQCQEECQEDVRDLKELTSELLTQVNEDSVEVPSELLLQVKEEPVEDVQSTPEEDVQSTLVGHESNELNFMFSPHPSLENIRQQVAEFADERNWNLYHKPRNLLLALVGEVGELSELFQWKDEVKPGLPGWTDREKEHLGEELSDVLLYLIRLSDTCHIDLPSAVVRKLALNAKKYPVHKAYGSSKKYTEFQSDSENEV